MENLERQAIRLMVYRMVVGFTFFLSAIGIQVAIGGESTLQPFYYLIAFILGLNLLYLILFLFAGGFRRSLGFIYLQLGGDILAVTLLSFLMGGFGSFFTFLYHILIVVAGFLLKKRGAFTIATANSIVFGLLCITLFYGWLPPDRYSPIPWEPPTAKETLYALTAHYVGFFLIAALVSMMAGRLETTRTTLGLVQKDLSSLRHLNDQIVSSLEGGLITTDVQGQVTFSNQAAKDLLGQPQSDAWNLFHRIRSLDRRNRLSGESTERLGEEIVLEMEDERYLYYQLQPLKEGSERVGYLALIRDQTEIQRLRERLKVKDRMEVMGEMAANIAHEIRNPLGSISGCAQMLRRSARHSEKDRSLLSIIQRESLRLSKILDNVMRFSNLPRSALRPMRLQDLIQEVLDLFRHDPEFREEITLVKRMDPDLAPVSIDPDQIRQALWNLLQNARKAIKGEGTIEIGLKREGEEVILWLRDDGIGMDPTLVQDYLRPFRKGFKRGVGLGLSLVYQIMGQHGGHLEIETEPGKGTTCRLVFAGLRAGDDGSGSSG